MDETTLLLEVEQTKQAETVLELARVNLEMAKVEANAERGKNWFYLGVGVIGAIVIIATKWVAAMGGG